MKKCSVTVNGGSGDYEENVNYDPSNTEEQTFTVLGSVTLPETVENTDNISTNVTVKITVNAKIIPTPEPTKPPDSMGVS